MTGRPGVVPGTRLDGHILLSLPGETPRVWQRVTTTICRATVHDTLTAYATHRCRCPAAVRANSTYAKRVRTRRNHIVDADLTRNQLRALARIGYGLPTIAAAVGVSEHSLCEIRTGERARVKRATAQGVERFYRAHREITGTCQRARTEAVRHGWASPGPADLVRVDEVKVQRARDGLLSAQQLNAAERAVLRQDRAS